MIDKKGRITKLIERQEDMLGNADGRAYTTTLRVSPDGNNADGLSWRTAFTTVNGALDVASTDANDLTLILIAPHATYYDINLTGTPTWTANVVLQGTHRHNAAIRNSHAAAGCILKLEGKSVVRDLRFYLHPGTTNGVIFEDKSGIRAYRCEFHGEDMTEAGIALYLNASGLGEEGVKIIDCDFFGNLDYMTALKVQGFHHSNFERVRIHNCARGIWVQNAVTDHNLFNLADIGECTLGIDIDSGNEQIFSDMLLHHNTRNVDDEVGDHVWLRIVGQFRIAILPDDLTGTTVSTHADADTWGTDTELLAAVGRDNPFRIVGIHTEPSAAGWFSVRFSADSGATYYDVLLFDATKREGIAAPSGTEFIFNAGTRISASAKSDTGGDSVQVWLEIQEI